MIKRLAAAIIVAAAVCAPPVSAAFCYAAIVAAPPTIPPIEPIPAAAATPDISLVPRGYKNGSELPAAAAVAVSVLGAGAVGGGCAYGLRKIMKRTK